MTWGSPIRKSRMGSNQENEGDKECHQIVKSNDLESNLLTMSLFLLPYARWLDDNRVSYSRTWETKCSPHVVSTGWSHRAYGKRNNNIVKRLLSKSFDFTIWWHSLAPSFSWFDPMRLFLTRLPQVTSLCIKSNNIYHEIAALSPETLMKVMKTTKKPAISCQNNRGGHLKDIIFKN